MKEGKQVLAVEADPRHAALIIEELGLKGSSKSRSTPGEKVSGVPDLTPIKDEIEVRRFRSLTMRAHYLAEDRYDLKFASKELAREMKCPTVSGMAKLKHLGRFLLKKP
eukprot:2484678-Pyramimonas_sp.AAC.1